MTGGTATRRRIAYLPALDGVRALAVAAVVLFHADVGPTDGGFLGVSVFFTLSGFLITSLLVAESAVGSIDLRSFYGRRVRRLLPAAWLCLVGVLLATPWWSDVQRSELGGDVLASLANVANWRFALADTSYRELLGGDASPVAHFWSLAIEEQMYLLLPVAVVVVIVRGRRLLGGVLLAGIAASVAAMLLTSDFDLAYNGTHTRAAELLVGALLATIVATPTGPQVPPWMRRWLPWAGAGALAALTVAVAGADLTTPWLVEGGFVAIALLSSVVVLAASQDGWFARTLSIAPLRLVGRVSYGIYLFHWPVFLLVTPDRLGVDGLALLAARLAVTALVTTISWTLVEVPIRSGRRPERPGMAPALALSVAVTVAIGAVLVPTPPPTETERLFAAADDQGIVTFADAVPDAAASGPGADGKAVGADTPYGRESVTGGDDELPTAASDSDPRPAEPPVVLVVGSDRQAVDALDGVDDLEVVDAVQPDCPVADGVEIRTVDGAVVDISRCESVVDRLERAAASAGEIDLVVISIGEVDDGVIRRPGEVGFPTVEDIAEYGTRRAAAERDVERGVEALRELGAPIVFAWWGGEGIVHGALERIDLESEAVRAVVASSVDLRREVADIVGAQDGNPANAHGGSGAPVRTLVVGDSTSLHLAQALHDASGRVGDPLEIVWAGRMGCPVVEVSAIRTETDGEVTPVDCDDLDDRLPPILASFDPQVVLVAAGPIEFVDHVYPGLEGVHAPGGSTWVDVHDREMDDLLDLLDDDVRVLVADSPPITAGGFSTVDMTDPARRAAWNAQVERWVVTHSRVDLFELDGPLTRYEADHGSIRPDGVHADVALLTDLAEQELIAPVVAAG